MSTLAQLKTAVQALETDVEKFYNTGNKAAGTRLRIGLQQIKKLAHEIRKDVHNIKKSKSEKSI
jgi:hypothetical protein